MTPYEKQLKTLSQCLEGKKMTAINFTENEEIMNNRIVDIIIYALGFVSIVLVWLTA
jgi:hypothetical protein